MKLLNVSTRLEEGRALLTLQGELDLATVGEAESALSELERGSDATTVIVDLRTVRFMDSIGLHFVPGADARTRDRGGRLVVIRGPEAVDRVFRLALLDDRPTLVDEPDQASSEREATGA